MVNVDSSQFPFILLIPELVLVGFAFFILLRGAFSKGGGSRTYVGLTTCIGLAAAGLWSLLFLFDVNARAFYGAIQIDNFSVFFKIIIIAGAFIVTLMSMDYLRRNDIQICEYYTLLLFATVGMTLLASASDLITIFISIEIMSLSVYVLVGIRRNEPFAIEAALKYFILGSFASGILVYGIALVYGASKSIHLVQIGFAAASGRILEPSLFGIGMGLILVGFGFKVASVPFHMWAPDVYQGAPAPITGFMSMGVKAAAFAAAIRVFMVAFNGEMPAWQPIVWWLAVLTMLAGNLMALMQENIKRMLAYSSIAHAGYLLVGLAVGGEQAGAAMLYYLAAYAFMNLGAFGVIVAVSGGEQELENIPDWSGLAYRYPVMGAAMALCLFSLIGMPPTAGFFAKFYLFYSAVAAGDVPIVIIGVIASMISLYFYLKVIVTMYMRDPDREVAPASPNLSVRLGVLLASFAVLYLGIVPGTALEWATSSIATLF
jgi:NADH-quinone oxidoreductase subunit N